MLRQRGDDPLAKGPIHHAQGLRGAKEERGFDSRRLRVLRLRRERRTASTNLEFNRRLGLRVPVSVRSESWQHRKKVDA